MTSKARLMLKDWPPPRPEDQLPSGTYIRNNWVWDEGLKRWVRIAKGTEK